MINTLSTPKDIEQHVKSLIILEPKFATIYHETGLPTLTPREGGFASLFQAIVSQQISVAAANAVLKRLQEHHVIDEQKLLDTDDKVLRACGLSKQKIRYVRSLAEHHIDYEALTKQDNQTVMETLTAVTGIGSWTAEIYLLFALKRSDVFAHNDLALQVAAQELRGLSERPKEREMRKIATAWSPHRSVASLLLWQSYRVLKGRVGINA